MKKLLTLILVLCSVVGFAQMRGGSQYDPGAARANLSNVDATATPSMASITLSGKVKAAWADILDDIYASGTVKVSTGAAAAPAYSFASDPNTGMYSPDADTLAFAEGGVESFRVNSAGEMLIATSTDAGNYKLQVNGDSLLGSIYSFASNLELGFQRTATGSAYIDMRTDNFYTDYGARLIRSGDRNSALEIINRGTGGIHLYNSEAGPVKIYTSGSECLRVTEAGNVLVNTTTNDTFNKVQVAGAVKSFLHQHGAIKSHFAQVGASSPATSTLIVFGMPNNTEGTSVLVETVGYSHNGKYTTWKAFIGCQNNSGTITVSNASLSMTQVENIGTPITAPIITTEIAGTQVIMKTTFSGPHARYSSIVHAAGYVDNPR